MASFSLADLRKGFWRCAFSVPAIAFYLLLTLAKVLAQEPTKELIEAAKNRDNWPFGVRREKWRCKSSNRS